MLDGIRTERNDINWIITNDVESLKPYVELFNLGTLRPLTDLLAPVTPEEIAAEGLLEITKKRRELLFQMPNELKEQTTFYTVLSDKEWMEMKLDLTKPKPKSTFAGSLKGLKSPENWLSRWMQVQYFPTAFTFMMTNSAIVNDRTFWELRLSNTDVWRRLMQEHVPPEHQFQRRTQ